MSKTCGRLKRIFRSFVLNNSNGMIVYSDNVKSYFSNEFPGLTINVCPNIQNPSSFISNQKINSEISKTPFQEYSKLIGEFMLYVGRFEYEKGIDLLFASFSKLKNQKINLVLIGSGSIKIKLKDLAINLKIDHRIFFIENLYDQDLYDFYRNARLFILPSRFEPFGAVVNEALILGCPVLVSNIAGSNIYIIEKENGLIIDPINEIEFTRSIEFALTHFNFSERKNLMRVDFGESAKAYYNSIY
jgi:glycosyltransferase involved in cell wall biosynthesis